MKLLLIDDHAMVRQGVAAMLEQAHADARVLHASSGEEGLRLAEHHDDLDAVLLDLSMPGADGIEVLSAFGASRPALPVIVLSAAEDPERVREAFAAGALGYVPKAATSATLLSALQLVLSGEVFVPSLMVQAPEAVRPPWSRNVSAPIGALTGRQAEVLGYIGEGLSNRTISRKLGLSEKTVKAHVTAIFRALSVSGRPEAIHVARGAGLI